MSHSRIIPPASPSSSPLNLTFISRYKLTFDNSSILLSINLSLFIVTKLGPSVQSIFNFFKFILNILCFSSNLVNLVEGSISIKSSIYCALKSNKEFFIGGSVDIKEIVKKSGV